MDRRVAGKRVQVGYTRGMTASSVHYSVSLQPHAQQATVEVHLENVPTHQGGLRVRIPTWVPGAYAFMRYGRAVHTVAASGPAGALTVERDGLSGWRIGGAGKDVTFRYALNLADSAWSELTGYIQHDQAVLLGTVLVQAPEHKGPVSVSYSVPPGWRVHVPDGAISSQSTYTFLDYTALQDSPVSMGVFETRTRDFQGTPFEFLFLNRCLGFSEEVEGWMDGCMRIVAECHRMFGGFPFRRYAFVVSFSPDHHWGLEHRASTMIGLGPDAFIDPRDRMSSHRLVAHELFHAWNVCSMRPRELVNLDLADGSFTDGLWVAEGVTRYHEYLLCVRAGLMAPAEMFSNVVNYWRHLRWMPAYRRVSPAESSRATFLNHHRFPGMLNTAMDYYDAGMLVAFDLDAALVCHTRTALPEAFGRFYKAHAEQGFTLEDAVAFFRGEHEAAGQVVHNEVPRAGALTVEERLGALGFQVSHKDVPFLGFTLVENKGPKVWNVLDDSPAAAAGVASGDILTEVQGVPFSVKSLQWAVGRRAPVTLRVQRGGAFHTFTISPSLRQEVSGLVWSGTDAQLGRLRSWLMRDDLAWTPGEAVPLTWHDNFHGIQNLL